MIHLPMNKEANPTHVVIRNNSAGTIEIGVGSGYVVSFAANQTHLFANTYWKEVYKTDETDIDTLLDNDTLDFMLLPDYRPVL